MMELGKRHSCIDGIRKRGERAKMQSRSQCRISCSCGINLFRIKVMSIDREIFALFRYRKNKWMGPTGAEMYSFNWKYLKTVMELGHPTLLLFISQWVSSEYSWAQGLRELFTWKPAVSFFPPESCCCIFEFSLLCLCQQSLCCVRKLLAKCLHSTHKQKLHEFGGWDISEPAAIWAWWHQW